jgi:short subunit fatty acids transporter
MENNMTVIMIAIIAAVALVVFLIARNQKDMKELNPDITDALDEEKMEQNNDRDRI